MPIVFATPRTQSRQCLGAVISSADVERLDAACALAREAGLEAGRLEEARANAAELRRATAAAAGAGAATTASTDGASSPVSQLRSAIESFEAFVAAHGGGRAACGRDLAAARAAFASASASASASAAAAPSGRSARSAAEQQQQPPQPAALPSSPPSGTSSAARRPQTAGALGASAASSPSPSTTTAFDRWLAGKRAAAARARKREADEQRRAAEQRQATVERNALTAVKRYARERGWPSALVVERASVPALTTSAAAAAGLSPFSSLALSRGQPRSPPRPRTAPA